MSNNMQGLILVWLFFGVVAFLVGSGVSLTLGWLL